MTEQLVHQWHQRAATLEPYAPEVAHTLRECARELEQSARADALDAVSLAEAAILSGYTSDALGRMIKRGEIENVGNKRRPRIRRRDVPKKPGYRNTGIGRGNVDASIVALEARRA